MSKRNIHETHPDIIKRLKRANGHLATIVKMIENERPCLEVAQQLHAVEKAVSIAKKILIHDHIDHCLDESVHRSEKNEQKDAIKQFKEITKYL